MKIVTITPTRGDRPEFVEQAMKLLGRQTRQPDDIIIITAEQGVTGNVKTGFYQARRMNADAAVIIEDDDLYGKAYLEIIERNFDPEKHDLFGFSDTIYYHLKKRAYRNIQHPSHASLMSTTLNPNTNFEWPEDHENFLDTFLWSKPYRKKLLPYSPNVGIKHGIGKTGGKGHLDTFPYPIDDSDMSYLNDRSGSDPFYIELSEKLSGIPLKTYFK